MNKSVLIRVLVSAGVILGATCLLFFLTLQGDVQFYKHVDEVMVSPDKWYGKSLQLHGFVDGVPERRGDSFDIRFTAKTGVYKVQAYYHGTVPDTLKDGAEVVLTGHLSQDGFHVADGGITAKCPSKYQVDAPAGTGR